MIKIGNVKINTNIFLAPLAGCSDLSFRLISREHGAKFCFYEMIDANALFYNSKSVDTLELHKKDKPVAAQMIGPDPDMMLTSAKKLLNMVDISFLDINAACPVRKMIAKKSGAYLIKEPENLYKIIRKLSNELPIPVTVKMRIGYGKADINRIVQIAKECERSSASAIFVHGRTKAQGNSGPVNYEAIKAVKQAVKIPVFGSGNILTPELAKKMLDKTGCDGIIVAQGAFGNPWIFKQIERYIKTGKPVKSVSFDQKRKTLKKHLAYLKKYNGDKTVSKVGFMRKVAHWYLKSFSNANKIRDKVNRVQNYNELIKVIDVIKF